MNTPKEIDYLYNHALDANSVVVEVGAYHCDWGRAISERYGCRVYAYEPLSEFYQKALKNEAECPNLHLINAAVGATERFAHFHIKGTMTGEFNGEGEAETVKVIPIEDVLNACGTHCSLLALNCEGGEFEILESMIAQELRPAAVTASLAVAQRLKRVGNYGKNRKDFIITTQNSIMGQRFSCLVVEKEGLGYGSGVIARCDCGAIVKTVRPTIIKGRIKSCGCSRNKLSSDAFKAFMRGLAGRPIPWRESLIGQKFNSLRVIEFACNSNQRGWRCRCDCGNERFVRAGDLKSGKIKSCKECRLKRCISKFIAHNNSIRSTLPHWDAIYTRWQFMNYRCHRKDMVPHKVWNRYGGRGISVCEQWRKDFRPFYDWAIKNGFDPNLVIDRRNNDAGYSPENCRWVTSMENANNKSNNVRVVFNGEEMTLSQAARKSGIQVHTLGRRLSRKWSAEKLFTPSRFGQPLATA